VKFGVGSLAAQGSTQQKPKQFCTARSARTAWKANRASTKTTSLRNGVITNSATRQTKTNGDKSILDTVRTMHRGHHRVSKIMRPSVRKIYAYRQVHQTNLSFFTPLDSVGTLEVSIITLRYTGTTTKIFVQLYVLEISVMIFKDAKKYTRTHLYTHTKNAFVYSTQFVCNCENSSRRAYNFKIDQTNFRCIIIAITNVSKHHYVVNYDIEVKKNTTE
jgi:hypothetical protein